MTDIDRRMDTLREERADLLSEARKVLDLAERENRDFTVTERAEWRECLERAEEIERELFVGLELLIAAERNTPAARHARWSRHFFRPPVTVQFPEEVRPIPARAHASSDGADWVNSATWLSHIATWREPQTQRLKRVFRSDMEACRHGGGTVLSIHRESGLSNVDFRMRRMVGDGRKRIS